MLSDQTPQDPVIGGVLFFLVGAVLRSSKRMVRSMDWPKHRKV